MISISNSPRYSDEERRSIQIGRDIHAAVIEEGRAETAGRSDGKIVFGYLDHDLIGTGKLPFVKYDQRTGKMSRTFSKSLADRIRSHVDDLKIYFDYVLACDHDSVGSSSRNNPQAPVTRGHVGCDCHGVTRLSISSSGVKTAVLAVAVAAAFLISSGCNEIRDVISVEISGIAVNQQGGAFSHDQEFTWAGVGRMS